MKVYAGDYFLFYDPSLGENEKWYVNDHCIIKGDDGWHLFGITHKEPAAPLDEKCCAHAIGKSLKDNMWKKLPYPIITDENHGESHFWAPHVIYHEGLYYMYWCAGSIEGSDKYKIMLATSKDLHTWERRTDVNPIVIDGYDARDPMIFRMDNKWVMYYTANSTPQGGNYVVACVTSDDLLHFGNKRVVFTDPRCGKGGGPCESPYVIHEKGKYYLFIGPRGSYNGTSVFESDDPFSFSPENEVGHLPAHAAEVIQDADGNYYTTRAGWGQGGVYIAPLYFEE